MESGANPTYTPLAWDSETFGFPVARLEAEVPDRLLECLRDGGIRLAYGVLPWQDASGRARLEREGALLVDHKIRFRKERNLARGVPEGVSEWSASTTLPGLEALALASGHHSRYKVDPKMPGRVFEGLYLTWIRRSVAKEIADGVLITGRTEDPTGMITVSVKEALADIGLIAVNEQARGQGLGRRLVFAAEAFGRERGALALEVVTQGGNQGACALYSACGYRVVLEQAIYHLWVEPRP